MWEKYKCSIPEDFIDGNSTDTGASCGGIRDDFDSVFRDPVTGDMPWPGTIFGLTVIATWYWCTDQVRAKIVQNLKFNQLLLSKYFSNRTEPTKKWLVFKHWVWIVTLI